MPGNAHCFAIIPVPITATFNLLISTVPFCYCNKIYSVTFCHSQGDRKKNPELFNVPLFKMLFPNPPSCLCVSPQGFCTLSPIRAARARRKYRLFIIFRSVYKIRQTTALTYHLFGGLLPHRRYPAAYPFPARPYTSGMGFVIYGFVKDIVPFSPNIPICGRFCGFLRKSRIDHRHLARRRNRALSHTDQGILSARITLPSNARAHNSLGRCCLCHARDFLCRAHNRRYRLQAVYAHIHKRACTLFKKP